MRAGRSKITPVIEVRSSRDRAGFGRITNGSKCFPMSTDAAPLLAGIATSRAPSSQISAASISAASNTATPRRPG